MVVVKSRNRLTRRIPRRTAQMHPYDARVYGCLCLPPFRRPRQLLTTLVLKVGAVGLITPGRLHQPADPVGGVLRSRNQLRMMFGMTPATARTKNIGGQSDCSPGCRGRSKASRLSPNLASRRRILTQPSPARHVVYATFPLSSRYDTSSILSFCRVPFT